jgi:uncharacterized protein (TIGR02284 family)
MAVYAKVINILQDLIQLHTDRIDEYHRIILENTTSDLKVVFTELVRQSKEYRTELVECLGRMDLQMQEPTAIRQGSIFLMWSEEKESLMGSSRKSILEYCDLELYALKYAYEVATLLTEDLDDIVHATIMRQLQGVTYVKDAVRTFYNAL